MSDETKQALIDAYVSTHPEDEAWLEVLEAHIDAKISEALNAKPSKKSKSDD